jgi:hypothetical protein
LDLLVDLETEPGLGQLFQAGKQLTRLVSFPSPLLADSQYYETSNKNPLIYQVLIARLVWSIYLSKNSFEE